MHSSFQLLAVLGVILIANPLVHSVMNRLNLPAPVGYMGLGIGLAALDTQLGFVDSTFSAVFSVLAELGVVALLFRVGLRSQLQGLLAKLPDASFIWVGNVLVSAAAGFLLARFALQLPLPTALVVATAFTATSVAVSVAVWDECGLLRSETGSLLIDVAELDDLSTVLLLTVLLAVIPLLLNGNGGVAQAAATIAGATVAKLLLFIALCYLFSHFLEQRFTRFNRDLGEDGIAMVITILGAGLVISALAGALGFSIAIGALFAGLAFSRDPEIIRNEGRFNELYEFFSPFFFIHIGMHVAPSAFMGALDVGLLLFVAAALAKLVGTALPALSVLTRSDAVLLGLSMIPRAEIAMLVVYECSLIGDDIVPQELFAALIVMAILTSLIAPPLVRARLQNAESRPL
jgi:Kef-type K+ transport system membrane component KefB